MTNDIISLLGRAPQDPDLQAGSRGLSIAEVVERYFKHPGEALTLLRSARGSTIEGLARASGVDAAVITAYETGEAAFQPRDVVELSKALQADLKVLLQAFALVKPDASEESLGIAAQFAGDLSSEEKLDLKRLIEAFSAGRDDRSG